MRPDTHVDVQPESDNEDHSLFTARMLEHLKKLGEVIVSNGGCGNIVIEVFRGDIVNLETTFNQKKGYQF